jgi:glycosyltransferase involved in cell wall biosynthesis
MKVWIVVPAYNESTVIGRVLAELRPLGFPVVVVDDASDDGTPAAATRAGATVLTHVVNRGQGAALKTGILYALEQGADAIVTFDADGQHDVKDVSALLSPILDGRADVALGSRFLALTSNVPPVRRAILRLAVLFTRVVSRITVSDTHNGLRAFSRRAAEQIRIVQDRMAHASEILDEIARNRLRFVEVPVTIRYSEYSRAKGQSSFALFKIALKFLLAKLSH